MVNNDTIESQPVKDLDSSFLLSASAGTGKTYTLTNRYFQILCQRRAEVSEILAITFTEKATNEMVVKIRDLIAEKLRNSKNAEERKYWESVYNSIPFARITTVHSWCARILREAAFFLNLDPNFRILDESSLKILFSEIYERFLEEEFGSEKTDLINILNNTNHNLLESFLNKIIEKRVQFSQIAEKALMSETNDTDFVSYWEKEVKRIFISEVINSPNWMNLIRALELNKPLDNRDILALKREALLEFDADCRGGNEWSIQELLEKIKGGGGRKSAWQEGSLPYVRNIVSRIRAILKKYLWLFEEPQPELEKKLTDLTPAFYNIGLRFIKFYNEELRKKNALDFHSLEVGTIEFIKKYPDKWQSLVAQLKYVLVDEFQDINPDQFFIIDSIMRYNNDVNFLFVGDEKQSIYGFRDADVTIFKNLRKKRYYGAKVKNLGSNFRSIKRLVEFQNLFFRFLMPQGAGNLEFEAVYEIDIEAVREEGDVQKPVRLLIPEKEPDTEQKDYEVEFEVVADEILRLVDEEEIFIEALGNPRKICFSDICILMRASSHAEELKRILQNKGIPFSAVFGRGFYESREVIDVLNYLKIIFNPADDLTFVGILRSPFVGIQDTDIYRMSLIKGNRNWFETALKLSRGELSGLESGVIESLKRFFTIYFELRCSLENKRLSEFIEELLYITDYLYIVAGDERGKHRVANLYRLIDIAYNLEKSTNLSVFEFSRYASYLAKIQAEEAEEHYPEENAVQLMTIHRSKGLEFPVIFLIESDASLTHKAESFYLDEKYFLTLKLEYETSGDFYYPYSYRCAKSVKALHELAEEKRLFYVAVTRAKNLFYMSLCKGSKWDNDEITDLPASYSDWLKNWKISSPDSYGAFVKEFRRKEERREPVSSPGDEEQVVDFEDDIEKPLSGLEKRGIISVNPSSLPGLFARLDGNDEGQSGRRGLEFSDILDIPPEISGTMIHKYVQYYLLHDFNTDTAQKILRREFRGFESFIEEKSQEWNRWIEEFTSSEVGANIKKADKVYTEYEFSSLFHDIIFQGSIDLLIINGNDLLFLDWKSDKINNTDTEGKIIYYRPQMLAYHLVLRKIFTGMKISGGIWFFRLAAFHPCEFTTDDENNFLPELRGKLHSINN